MSEGAVLSDAEILANLGGDVIIHPFNESQVAPCSYDVTLGEYFWKPNINDLPEYMIPDQGVDIFKYWGVDKSCKELTSEGKKLYGCSRALKIVTFEQAHQYGVNLGDEIIIIPAGHVILAHTREFIGGRHHVTTMLKARSSMGRCGVSVCGDSGWGDVGYFNRWTLEIENHSLRPIILKVGQRIAQIVFFQTGPVLNPYSSKGQYQTSDKIEELIESWSPLCMIPGKAVSHLEMLLENHS